MSKTRFPAIRSALTVLLASLLAIGCGARAPTGAEPPAPTPETPAPEGPTPPAETPPLPAPSAAAALDTVRAGRFDNGKMWTFEYPPLEYFQAEYGFAPDSSWFERARLGALRIPGCSASFVSTYGLIMTNHHCARESITQVSQPGENLLDNGFYARSLDEERPVDEFYADQLIAIIDMTDSVYSAVEGITDMGMRAERREEIAEELRSRVEERYAGEGEGIVVEMIALWNGAKYSAYVFRRYNDLRLVMAPHGKVTFFGGDPDNFTYPRYDLDMSFYRIYGEDEQPLRTEYYFPWDTAGAQEEEPIFVVGNPGSTSRLQTVAELEFRRDVQDKAIVDFYASRAAAFQEYYDQHPERGEQLDLQNTIFSLLNSHKAHLGIWTGLNDPVIMAKRRDAERQFREAIESDSALRQRFGGLFEQMEDIQRRKARVNSEIQAFVGFGGEYTPPTMLRAFYTFYYLLQRQRGVPEESLAGLQEALLELGDQPEELQISLMAARFSDFQRYFGAGSEVVGAVLRGRTPSEAAESIIRNSVLSDSAKTASGLADGTLAMTDPALEMIAAVARAFAIYQSSISPITDEESAVAAELGRARFEVYGTEIPPDATFSLRIADGIVRGYEYNGTLAPAHTTFYGLYDRYYSFGGGEWDLPDHWLNPPNAFELATPLNFVSTADIIGGNSGSPVINRDLRAVGLVFDGNIESLPGDYIYEPTSNRAVAVDVRGMLEALDDMYDADRLVLELTAGRLVETEEEADAVTANR